MQELNKIDEFVTEPPSGFEFEFAEWSVERNCITFVDTKFAWKIINFSRFSGWYAQDALWYKQDGTADDQKAAVQAMPRV